MCKAPVVPGATTSGSVTSTVMRCGSTRGEVDYRATLRGRHGTFRFPKVHPAEISKEFLETLGFLPAGGHRLYAATLRRGSGSP